MPRSQLALEGLQVDDLRVEYTSDAEAVHRSVTRGEAATTATRPRFRTHPDESDFSAWWSSFLRGRRVRPPRSPDAVRFLDLFSSVGGLSLGATEAIESFGMRGVPLLAADVDERALEVYRRNLRPRETVGESVSGLLDFRVSGAGEQARFAYEPSARDERLASLVGSVDLILAGPPCQGHSSLNNYSRHDDPKNLLYLTVPAAAVAVGAKHVVIENVPNVVADKNGVVQSTIALFKESGYNVSSGVLAADKLGWPQTRKRYFLVASKDSMPLDLTALKTSLARKALPLSWALNDRVHSVSDDASDVMNSLPVLSAENRERLTYLFDQDVYELPNDIRPDCHKDGTTYRASYGRMRWDEPAPTITGGFLTPGRGRFVHPLVPRVLTPREAARVQGFPDWYDFIPDERALPSRAELTRWIGNAVPSILGYVATLAALAGEGAVGQGEGDRLTMRAA